MFTQLKKIVMPIGVSGDEGEISAVLAAEIAPYVDKIYNDALGNLIAFKKGKGKKPKKLMFAAHMDEIGFMASYIDEKGFIRVSRVGGINYQAAVFSEVIFKNGTKGVLVPEARIAQRDYRPENYYVDIGAKSRSDAMRRVKIGDTCRVAPNLFKLAGSRVAGRPIDDRIGCMMLVETAKAMKECENDTYFVFTVQEEVGVRGARTSAFSITPDYAVAIDIGGSGDTPSCVPLAVNLGEGIAIKIKDAMVICNPFMISTMKEIAKEKGVPYQLEILEGGGTDTCMLQQAAGGCIAGALSVPTRYGHSGVEVIDMNDVAGGIKILTGLCETKLN